MRLFRSSVRRTGRNRSRWRVRLAQTTSRLAFAFSWLPVGTSTWPLIIRWARVYRRTHPTAGDGAYHPAGLRYALDYCRDLRLIHPEYGNLDPRVTLRYRAETGPIGA